MLPKLTFVLGGGSSGKSAFAEGLANASGLSRHYVATAQVLDDEMRDKVRLHRLQRGLDWTVHEAPLDLSPALKSLNAHDVVLVDCATMWLSNQMMQDHDLPQAGLALIEAITQCRAPVIIVSNEVGHGIVPDNALARSFRHEQGRLNIALAQQADLAVFVTAGLPQVLKGTLP